MAKIKRPAGAKERADEIADLITEGCEKLVDLSIEWFELNDMESLRHAREMLEGKEVTLMLTARVENRLAHIALNLLRTSIPMPRPYFEVQVPMSPWVLSAPGVLFDDPIHAGPKGVKRKHR